MTVSVSYLSKNCTTCLFISKSFKELFFKHFRFESGCKGKVYFWTTKTFRSFFFKKSFFWSGSPFSVPLFSISTHLHFSLESGCKITALRHILQTSATLFSYFFAFIWLNHWLSKNSTEHIFKSLALARQSALPYYLYTRTYYVSLIFYFLPYTHSYNPKTCLFINISFIPRANIILLPLSVLLFITTFAIIKN